MHGTVGLVLVPYLIMTKVREEEDPCKEWCIIYVSPDSITALVVYSRLISFLYSS